MVDTIDFFPVIRKHPERFYLIHYSSERLFDEATGGLSPRITSIVVMHYQTQQIESYALHAVAETLGIPRDQVQSRFDEIERELLSRFYAFVRDRRQASWVHWNMRSLVFGFEHLEHRYRLLTKSEPPSIPVEVRVNLNDALKQRYGPDYAPDPRMKSLMLLQGDLSKQFMEGAEESEAFKAGDYIRMNASTISKVQFFKHVIEQTLRGKLRTAGRSLFNKIDRLLESRSARVMALTAAALALGAWFVRILLIFVH